MMARWKRLIQRILYTINFSIHNHSLRNKTTDVIAIRYLSFFISNRRNLGRTPDAYHTSNARTLTWGLNVTNISALLPLPSCSLLCMISSNVALRFDGNYIAFTLNVFTLLPNSCILNVLLPLPPLSLYPIAPTIHARIKFITAVSHELI
jgi:hypothetical protein